MVRNDLFSEITHPDRAADARGYGDPPHPAGIPLGLVKVACWPSGEMGVAARPSGIPVGREVHTTPARWQPDLGG